MDQRARLRSFVVMMFAAVFMQAASAETLTGRIVGVSDGDTVTLLDPAKQQHKIRLTGIDAPEKRQAYGKVSRQHLAGLVFGRQVAADCGKTDRYGRLVCVIEVAGVDANLAQVAAGLAWHYKRYQGEQRPEDRVAYSAAEERARRERVGLWADAAPVAPWEFRKARREAAALQ